MIIFPENIKHEENYITNCVFLNGENVKEPIFSENNKGELIVKMNKLWVIDECFLSDEMKENILKAAMAHNLGDSLP